MSILLAAITYILIVTLGIIIKEKIVKYFHKCKFNIKVKDLHYQCTTTKDGDVQAHGKKIGETRKCKCNNQIDLYYREYYYMNKYRFITENDITNKL